MGNKKISSVQFVDVYFPVIDGVVRVVDNYASTFTKMGNECRVVAPRMKGYTDKSIYEVLRVSSFRLPGFGYNIPAPNIKGRKIKRYLKEHKFDIYHLHSPFTVGKFAIKMARKNKVPVVAHFHSKYYDDFLNITKSKVISKLLVKIILRTYNKADAVWTVNESSANTLREYGFKKEITVVPNGTEFVIPENILELEEEVLKKYNLKKDENLILYVGQLIWQKNLKLIFDTLKVLKDESFPFKMLVVGAGYNEKAIKKYASNLGLDDMVFFLGGITNKEELSAIYSVSDLFFFPSLYDTFSLVVREAAVLKTPSLLSKDSNACEGITNNVDGFIEETDPKKMAFRIKEILKDKKTLIEIGEKAALNIPFRWNDVIKRAEKNYQEIINKYKKSKIKNKSKKS
ncbi:MAG: glycosyltransferase [Bacilli bacterium]